MFGLLKNLSISQKILFPSIFSLVIFASYIVFSVIAMNSMNKRFDYIYLNDFQLLTEIILLKNDISESFSYLKSSVIANDILPYEDTIRVLIDKVDMRISYIEDMIEGKIDISNLREKWSEYRQHAEKILTDFNELEPLEEINLLNTKAESIKSESDMIVSSITDIIQQGISNVRRTNSNAIIISIVLSIFSSLSILFSFLIIQRFVSSPIIGISNYISSMFSGKVIDLSRKLKLDLGNDEIGTLEKNLNNFVQKISSIMLRIVGTSEQLDKLSNSLINIGENIMGMVDEQMSTIDRASATTKNLESVFLRVKGVSEDVGKRVNASKSIISESISAINQVVLVVKDISEIFSELTATTINFSESAKRISSIASSIKSIAEQINILSINASIEAARAGEQGKGFKVVAEEVGKLSAKTSTAAKEIEKTADKAQEDMRNLIQVQERAMKIINTSLNISEKASGELRKIQETYDLQMGFIENINNMIKEQSKIVSEVISQVSSVSRVSEKVQNSVNEIFEETRRIASLSNDLRVYSGEFKFL
ncbi:MAG: methyl-accepting chemotaxis protein [Candidatus Calescibacterium sp.]|nr:methyl-accepting chemotaxis protein [Candidatus Calescibacterium sp.]MCX7734758.1 methyl-accepting chemotaxis protein [bacterium]MDW8088103.1 methyl-accepting chemotaxis protein [Candidatus Calescibacterium sp.]